MRPISIRRADRGRSSIRADPSRNCYKTVMPELSVQNVYGLLIRSRLLPLEEAKSLYERWLAETKGKTPTSGQFTQWLIAHRYVTEYQAALLSRGHADHFFLGQYKL